MAEPACRWCRGRSGRLVLDLGEQPACDYFPRIEDPGPDPVYPLQMWLCGSCGLAQLVADPTVPEEPKGTEPAALVAQATDAVERVAAAGVLAANATVAEYGSPHGGSWLGLLSDRGLTQVDAGPADIVLDCFGLMHSADQYSALMERAARVRPGGVLLLQFHSLNTIVRHGQWNVLRHGHYAYYSTSALVGMLRTKGFEPWMAWQFDLYGGTVLLAARREADGPVQPDVSLQLLVDDDARVGVRDPDVVSSLQGQARSRCDMLRDWLQSERAAGKTALGYGAASRAVALLVGAGVDRGLLEMVVDASPAKQGLRMPGTDIPVGNPTELEQRRPDSVLLFVPDLLEEVRSSFPGVEGSGGRWVNADALGVWTPGASSSRP